MGGAGFFIFIAVFMTVVFTVQWAIERAKRQRATAFAAANGLLYRPGPDKPPPTPFRQFGIGRSKKVRHTFWREGDEHEAAVFEYQYTTGSGKNSHTHHFTCALFRTGLAAPHLVLDRQGFFRDLMGKLGMRDIQVESPQFNEAWHVSCDDERFAITLLDPPMIGWLMSAGGGGSIEIELIGDRGLAIAERRPIEEMTQLLAYTHQFIGQVPRVVHDLYPGR